MEVNNLSFDLLTSISIGLITFFLAIQFILYRQIVFVGTALFKFKTKIYEDFTINDEINRRLEISQHLVDEKIKCLEVQLRHLEEKWIDITGLNEPVKGIKKSGAFIGDAIETVKAENDQLLETNAKMLQRIEALENQVNPAGGVHS